MVHRLGICLAMRLSGRHSTASAASLAAEDDGGADDIRAAYPATAAEAPVSSQPAFDERGGGSPGSSSTRTREPSTSTRSPIFPSPSRPSFYMSFRTSVSPASAATG